MNSRICVFINVYTICIYTPKYEFIKKKVKNKYLCQLNNIIIKKIRTEFGLPESYHDLSNLKKRVISPSLDEITANTDIELIYENIKQGRSVVGFKFIVREKPKPKLIAPERETNTVDLFCNMSDAQINKYSTILSKLSELSDLSNFPDYPTFAIWISGILRDPKSVREETAKRILKALHQKTDFKP